MLKIQNLTFKYPDGTLAADDISFSLDEGENVALIGANGAGKTSLLLNIVGVLTLSGGTVEADGVLLGKKTINELRRKVGLVFQNPDDQLFMPLLYDDIAFGPRNYGADESETEVKVDSALKALGIEKLKNRSSLKLSGGEKRLAAIAAVMATEPSYLLFDEPTAFLDPRARRNLIGLMKKLPQGKLIATHDLSFAQEVCTRVIALKGGKIFAEGGAQLLRDSRLMDDCGLEAI
jgi:cobalt/nickel transport system ATP-binding protein